MKSNDKKYRNENPPPKTVPFASALRKVWLLKVRPFLLEKMYPVIPKNTPNNPVLRVISFPRIAEAFMSKVARDNTDVAMMFDKTAFRLLIISRSLLGTGVWHGQEVRPGSSSITARPVPQFTASVVEEEETILFELQRHIHTFLTSQNVKLSPETPN